MCLKLALTFVKNVRLLLLMNFFEVLYMNKGLILQFNE